MTSYIRSAGEGRRQISAPVSILLSYSVSNEWVLCCPARLLFCDGVWKGKGCGVSGHGLFLRPGGAEAQSLSEKHSVCRGPVQDMERRRVSL